jgi:hypothetical protein
VTASFTAQAFGIAAWPFGHFTYHNVHSQAAEFLADITKNDKREAVRGKASGRQGQRKERLGVKPLEEFHANPMYAGDLHRADMAWAKHAACCGLTLEQIKDELLNGRDLTKEGSRRKRQLEYAERTARKAVEQA